MHGARRGVTPSENPTLKNDHTQSDGDARLDRRKAISSLTRRVAHREGGSCKDGNEREGLNHLTPPMLHPLQRPRPGEFARAGRSDERRGKKRAFGLFDFFLFPATPANNRSLTNHARGEGARSGNTYLHSLSLFDLYCLSLLIFREEGGESSKGRRGFGKVIFQLPG